MTPPEKGIIVYIPKQLSRPMIAMNTEKHIQAKATAILPAVFGTWQARQAMIANTMSIRRNQNDVRRSVVERIGAMPEPMSEMFSKIILKPERKNGSAVRQFKFIKARKRLIMADIL